MTKLNQIVAIETGVKSKTARQFTDFYHVVQKAPLLSGISRRYEPRDEEGDTFPAESTLVQIKADQVIDEAAATLTRLFNVVLTKETANTQAKADVVVDGEVVLRDVPVTYLLFLKKQLQDLRTFFAKMPTLDPSEQWRPDPTSGTWVTDPIQTVKSKKVPRNWVKAEATDKHPAQVEIYHEDVTVGTWTTLKYSGALPVARVNELITRVDKLIEGVEFARENANNLEIVDVPAGDAIFNYLLEA